MEQNKQYSTMSSEETLRNVNSTSSGLTTEQAKRHQETYGPNELTDTKRKSTFQIFLEQFKDFLVLILIGAGTISAVLGDWESSLVIFAVIILNAILGTVQTKKAEQSLNSLKSLSAESAKVLRDNKIVLIPSREVTIGDIVYLEAGDSIVADGRLLECASLQVNESALTGESTAVEKQLKPLKDGLPIADQTNMVFSGTFATYGRGAFVVTSIGMDTEVGKIASLIQNAKEKRTPLQVNLDAFGQKLSLLILGLCTILLVLSMVRGASFLDSFMFAVALAVAAIPEALSSIVTIVLSFGTQKMAKEHAIIRKLQAVEGLGSVSVICSDKTGTLTQNKMTVTSCYVNGKIQQLNDLNTSESAVKELITYGVLCNDSRIENETEIGDPTETALLHFARKKQMEEVNIRASYERLSEIPFDSDRKLMSTVHSFDGKQMMITKGAVDVLLNRMNLSDKEKEAIQTANETFSKEGLRVLAFAKKEVSHLPITLEDETDYTFCGLIAMIDPPREESMEAVLACKSAGIRPVMITGDHKVTASAIAKQIGILSDGQKALDGAEIDHLTDEQLQELVPEVAVYARVSPEHKIRIVRAWQERGNIVAMTGDGVNDAPALKQADIGVAMGITGTGVAKDASSMILTDDNFATIVKAVENGRNIYANIKRSIQFLLSGNFAGILAVLYASLLALPLPFEPVHLLFINLLTDSLPAIALGLEPHNSDVMKEKPRPMNESIMTKSFLRQIGVEGLIIAIATLAAYTIGLQTSPQTASTMAFATLCLSRLFHGFNCKSEHPVLFTKQFGNNPYLFGAFFIGFVLLNGVLLIPALQPLFKTEALTLSLLFTIYGLAFGSMIVIQILKWIVKKVRK